MPRFAGLRQASPGFDSFRDVFNASQHFARLRQDTSWTPPPGTCLCHCYRRPGLESKSPGRFTLPGQSFLPLLPQGWEGSHGPTLLGPVCATATAGLGSKVDRPGDLLCRGNASCHCYRRSGKHLMDPPPGTCLCHCYRILSMPHREVLYSILKIELGVLQASARAQLD